MSMAAQASFVNTRAGGCSVTGQPRGLGRSARAPVCDGSELWRVRVDLFAEDRDSASVTVAHEALQRQLTASDEAAAGPGEVAADQGTGIEGRAVIGLSFWVRADDVGQAARTAVEAARRAGADSGAGSELYDVVVIPSAAVARPHDPAYPPMPD
jgi:hypothetical protein